MVEKIISTEERERVIRIFQSVSDDYLRLNVEKRKTFIAGTIYGLAEKVYMGATESMIMPIVSLEETGWPKEDLFNITCYMGLKISVMLLGEDHEIFVNRSKRLRKNQTCMVAFREVSEYYSQGIESRKRIFTIGYWSAQAQIVSLDLCKAAMFRPNIERHPWVFTDLPDITSRYDLVLSEVSYDDKRELWISKIGTIDEIAKLYYVSVNSVEWHKRRGLLCGVPENEIDSDFHKRHGYTHV